MHTGPMSEVARVTKIAENLIIQLTTYCSYIVHVIIERTAEDESQTQVYLRSKKPNSTSISHSVSMIIFLVAVLLFQDSNTQTRNEILIRKSKSFSFSSFCLHFSLHSFRQCNTIPVQEFSLLFRFCNLHCIHLSNGNRWYMWSPQVYLSAVGQSRVQTVY